MRIGIVAPMFPPLKSGSSHYAYRVAEGLAERGHDVFVITSSNSINDDSLPFSIIKTPSFMLPSTPFTHNYSLPFNFFPMNYPMMKALISKLRPDLLHVNGHFLDLSLVSSMAAGSLKVPSVLTIHTRLVHASPSFNPFIRAFDRSMVTWMLKATNSMIALDRQMYHYIKETYYAPDERIATIPLGIDIKDLRAQKDDPRIMEDLEGYKVIASLSHITALKSPRTLLEAFAKVRESIDNLKLLFIGSVNDPRVREWVKQLGVEEDVIFLGPVNHDLIPSILRRCVLETHSLDFRTGLDNAAIEAMALGLPVISCVREDNFIKPWLKNWENIVLVPPRRVDKTAEALKRILSDDQLYETLSQNASQSATKLFSLERMLDDLESLYAQVLSESSHR